MKPTLTALILLLFITNPAKATVQEKLKDGGSAVIREVIDGDTVILDRTVQGANQVRLVGLQAPKLPLGRKGFRMWPLAPQSRTALEALTLGRVVNIRYGGAEMDRHGRLLAHLFLEDGTWVQGQMLSIGMARVYTFPDNRAVVPDMLRHEQIARNAGKGIWAHPFYKTHAATPEALKRFIGTFQVIEGKVIDAARVKNRVYLNFGNDWRSDFTVTLNSRARKLFKSADVDPLDYKNKIIRVRGWLKKFNGPAINATHPEQIEIIKQ